MSCDKYWHVLLFLLSMCEWPGSMQWWLGCRIDSSPSGLVSQLIIIRKEHANVPVFQNNNSKYSKWKYSKSKFWKCSKVRHWKNCNSISTHISQVFRYLGVAQRTIEEYNERNFFFKIIIENIQSENIQNQNFENFSKSKFWKFF